MHGASKELAGRSLSGSIEAAQLATGVQGHLFEADFETFGHLRPKTFLVHCIWQFVHKYSLLLQFEEPKHLLQNQTNDTTLMHLFVQLNDIILAHLEQLNCCRQATHTLFLSDIAIGDGTQIASDYKYPLASHATLMPPQPSHHPFLPSRPTCNNWSLW